MQVLILTLVSFSGGVVWTSLNNFLYVFGFGVDGQGADDGPGRGRGLRLEPDWAGLSKADIQLLQHLRVLRE